MFNPTSNMNQNQDMSFSNNNKKLPNPSNYKIVKCKNYERGKKYFLCIFLNLNSYCSFGFINF